MFPRSLVTSLCLAMLAAAPAAARHATAVAQPEATGDPTPIGQVDHAVSPVGFTYTIAPGPAVPLAVRHRKPLHLAAKAPRRLAAH